MPNICGFETRLAFEVCIIAVSEIRKKASKNRALAKKASIIKIRESVNIRKRQEGDNLGVVLRRFHMADAQNISNYLSDISVSRYLSDSICCPYSFERAERFIHLSLDNFPLECAIELDGCFAGAINLIEKRDVYRSNLEVGYWLGRPYWNRGIAKEALRQITRVAFKESDIARVYAQVFVENTASCKVLEGCGYVQEGFHPKSLTKDCILYDAAVYATLRDSWHEWDRKTESFVIR